MSTTYKIALAALAGFLLGAWLFHSRSVKAQIGTRIFVQRAQLATSTHLNGEVIGFSCTQAQGEPACYVATH